MSVIVAIALILLYNILIVRDKKNTLMLLGTYGVVYLLTEILKRVTDTLRPNGELFSFPSRHAAFAFLIAFTLPVERYERVLLYIWATAVAFSRLILAEHWISDVVFGAGLGLLAGLTFKKYNKRTL
jgi:membrane-associated phospholipid phosphatase